MPEACCLSPEPICELRPALPPALARHYPQIPHTRAAWQVMEICWLHTLLRIAELEQPGKKCDGGQLGESRG